MSKISEFMSTTIYSTRTDTFAHEAIDKMYKNKVGALLVETGGKHTGIFTKTDWMVLVIKGECDPKTIKVSFKLISSLYITLFFRFKKRFKVSRESLPA